MRIVVLPLVGLLAMAASPSTGFNPTTPMPNFTAQAPAPAQALPPQGFTTAPTPNDDVFAPITRASKDASLGPGFFTRRDQYRGEGLSPGSSAQTQQELHVKPGAGFNLRMPLQ